MINLLKTAKIFHEKYGFNVLPLHGKRPIVNWENWQLIEQTENDVKSFMWNSKNKKGFNSVTGIGGICGINDLRCLDFDKVTNFDLIGEFVKKLGLAENYSWIVSSGSGNGFHIWIKVSENERLHKNLIGPKSVYRLLLKDEQRCDHIELRWKKSQTALPFSIHPNGSRYKFLYEEPEYPPVEIEADKLFECIEDYCNLAWEKEILEIGKREFRSIGYDREKLESAIEFLATNLPINCYEDWYRIGFGLVTIGEEGRAYFLKMSLSNPNYHDTETTVNKKFDSFIKDYDGKITLGTVYHIAEKYGWKKPFVKFWFVENDKTKISKQNFKRFLEENGFCKLRLEKGYLLLKVNKNIVKEVEIFNIKDFVIDYLKRLDDEYYTESTRLKVIDSVIKGASQHFNNSFLEFLETMELQFLRDTKDNGFMFFTNCFVEISESKIKSKRYEELEGFIWDKQVIAKKFVESRKESEFEQFIRNICKNDKKRISSLRSAIGYLLHNYKDSTNAKAIIFLDEKISDGAYGRSGKGLVAQAIGKLRKTIRLDGRNFNFSKNFSFQSITLDTAIIEFNDVTKKFNFDKLFSIITDDITVEKKNQDEMIIPFHQSPKIIISTNYTIEGYDDSALDRQFVIEFSDHYNKYHRPYDEFNHRFFDEWGTEEWNSFFNYMISCLQIYLNEGLIECELINLSEKKLVQATCEEFAEYFSTIEAGKEYLKRELLNNFIKVYDEFSEMQLVRFTRWLKDAAKIKGMNVTERKSGIERFIKLTSTHHSQDKKIRNIMDEMDAEKQGESIN